jgi:hypothetical protein
MRKSTGGRVLLSIILLLPVFLFYMFSLFRLLLVPFPNAFMALFGISVAQVEWRLGEYAGDVGQFFVMLTLFAGWARAILTYDASAPNARWVRVSGTSCFALWAFANIVIFFV